MTHDEWWTQKSTYDEICAQHNVKPNLDVCATEESTKVPDNFITVDEDMMLTDWSKHTTHEGQEIVAFMNPPNSDLKMAIKMAMKMWKDRNITILMLIPANVISRNYFMQYWDLITSGTIKPDRDWRPLFKRPQFLERGIINKMGNRNDYMSIVLRKREWDKLG